MLTNFNIEQFLSLDGYINNVRKNRRKLSSGNKGTQEFFTPYSIVKRMSDKIPDSDWADPIKTYLEPGFGDGNK